MHHFPEIFVFERFTPSPNDRSTPLSSDTKKWTVGILPPATGIRDIRVTMFYDSVCIKGPLHADSRSGSCLANAMTLNIVMSRV